VTGAPEDSARPSLPRWLAGLRSTSRARHTIALGALLSTAGVGLSGSASRVIGGVLLVLGWLVLAAGIHSFGRRGAA